MLHVDRALVERPEIYGSPEVTREFEKLRDFHLFREQRAQRQARSPLARHSPHLDSFVEAVTRVFSGKCGYCEQPVERDEGGSGRRPSRLAARLDRFRPHSEAVGLEGAGAPDHYWWLAFEWENHYLACASCLRYKRTQFPVLGDRIEYRPRARAYRRDKALLLDPCVDSPYRWLEFSDNGRVRGAPPTHAATRRSWQDFDRGEVTIGVLNLNRSSLIAARARVADGLLKVWREFVGQWNSKASEELTRRCAADAPHAGMARLLLAGRLLNEGGAGAEGAAGSLFRALRPEVNTLRARRRHVATREREAISIAAPLPRTGVNPEGQPALPLRTARIERVWLKNYKAIHSLELSFASSGDVRVTELTSGGWEDRIDLRVGWKMLLGENGTGKSTVLEALGSVMMGPRILDSEVQERLDIAPGKVLRRGSRWGAVRVKFDHEDTVWEMRITKTRYAFPMGFPSLATFVRGYGATRLLPGRLRRPDYRSDHRTVEVANLFDPYVPLIDAEAWLQGLSEAQFNTAARAITDLLNRERDRYDADGNLVPRTEELITRDNGRVLIEGDPLRDLSDGYRSVLAVCCDIMAAVPQMADMHSAAGIVLVDEIGAHLHPSWKMRIVPALRRTFPAVQFIATTHEPLALRGLLQGETTLMRRAAPGAGDGARRVSVREDLPSPSSLRVDQLLTSSLFGLDTTIDPDIDEQFSRLYYLIGLSHRTPAQVTECERLRADLAGFGVLGYTRRDQKIYELIDELIAQERFLDPERRKIDRERLARMSSRTRERVLALWSYADLGAVVSG